jgi:Family of unknown function (DUF6191)
MTQWGLDTLFNPAKRHMDEEKRRLQSTREEIGDSSGGKRIDLESGKVTIRRTDAAADETDADAEQPPENGADVKGDDKPAPSPAAVRAARRRGRQPR